MRPPPKSREYHSRKAEGSGPKKSPLISALDNFARKGAKYNMLRKLARDLYERKMRDLLDFQATTDCSNEDLAQSYLENMRGLKDHPINFVKTKS